MASEEKSVDHHVQQDSSSTHSFYSQFSLDQLQKLDMHRDACSHATHVNGLHQSRTNENQEWKNEANRAA